jgi:hypothetical protein
VALGLPLVVTVGWILGSGQVPPTKPAPAGAGGIGQAPGRDTSVGPTGDVWSPAPPRPVAVETRVPLRRLRSGPPARPFATRRDLPAPTATARPTAAPTEATTGPTGVPIEIPPSVEPPPVP